MDSSFATFAMETPTIVLSYAAAFFCVAVAIAAVYALVKLGRMVNRVDVVLDDVDKQAVPLMQKAGTTLDGVNANLGNVDEITKDVADITDKIDAMANAVEGAVSTPARKAASFSAGVQGAVSNFMRRDKGAPSGAAEEPPAWTPPVAADPVGDAAADAADVAQGAATAAADVAQDAATAAADAADAAAAVPETDAKV